MYVCVCTTLGRHQASVAGASFGAGTGSERSLAAGLGAGRALRYGGVQALPGLVG